MKILGIESSCDETAAAVVEDGVRLLSNVVNSQIDIHAAYGGVIPEVAARSHIEVILPVVEKALSDANCIWDDIDAIGVTYAPGLVGSLLIGSLTARTLAYLKKKPLYAVHHVEGHVYANFLTKIGIESQETRDKGQETPQTPQIAPAETTHVASEEYLSSPDASKSHPDSSRTKRSDPADDSDEKPRASWREDNRSEETASVVSGLQLPTLQPRFPLLALIVSGGHSQLVLFRDHGDYELLGQTQDDAVGEAFDKVAKIVGLPYPGGPSVAKAAESGDAHAFDFPKAKMPNKYDFSFSGLKTAVLRTVQRDCGVDHTYPSKDLPELVSDSLRANVAASFQRTAVETLVEKTLQAYHDYSPASVVIAGGVAANQELRRQLAQALPIPIEYAPMSLCTDNAAMIASLAYFMAQSVSPSDPLTLETIPSLSMTKTAWSS